MQKLTLREISLLALLLLVAAPASAQDRPEPTLKPYRRAGGAPAAAAGLGEWARLNRLPLNAELRVALVSKRVVKGALLEVTEDALVLSGRGGQSIPARDVLRIHHVRHDPLSNGLLIGLAAGAGGGAALGASLRCTVCLIFYPFIGAGVGAGVGALADSAHVEMDLVYEKAPTPVVRQE